MASIKTISQLDEVTSVCDDTLFEVAHPVNVDDTNNLYFNSGKTKFSTIKDSIYEYTVDSLSSENSLQDFLDIKTINENIDKINNDEVTFNGKKIFSDGVILGTVDESNQKSAVSFAKMSTFLDNNNALFIGLSATADGTLKTTREYETDYKFMMSGTTSNEVICNSSGIFTCYGWMDEIESNQKNNSARWVALEGKLERYGTGDSRWHILQLQPFISNVYCSYISFTFPVQKGLTLRIKCGFTPGTNSNKYRYTDNSLTTNEANTFYGAIYHS